MKFIEIFKRVVTELEPMTDDEWNKKLKLKRAQSMQLSQWLDREIADEDVEAVTEQARKDNLEAYLSRGTPFVKARVRQFTARETTKN